MEIITFNIGGKKFSTTRTTINKFPNTLLYNLIHGSTEGEHFIDRDYSLFPYVLNFYRNGKLIYPERDIRLFELELDFYLIPYKKLQLIEEILDLRYIKLFSTQFTGILIQLGGLGMKIYVTVRDAISKDKNIISIDLGETVKLFENSSITMKDIEKMIGFMFLVPVDMTSTGNILTLEW